MNEIGREKYECFKVIVTQYIVTMVIHSYLQSKQLRGKTLAAAVTSFCSVPACSSLPFGGKVTISELAFHFVCLCPSESKGCWPL